MDRDESRQLVRDQIVRWVRERRRDGARGARRYDPREWDSTFVFSARLTVAWRWREEFERQFERGAYDGLLRDPQE